ncbi:hypothetical protein GQ600_5951 [Phytophthora cactorum]|nr:hypothetical protein GQ600_5951 [Phytophthora cactorum]
MVLGKFIRHYLDREPMVVISCAIGAVGVTLPLVVVPIRRSMGLPTDQYDGPIIPDYIKKSRGHLAAPEPVTEANRAASTVTFSATSKQLQQIKLNASPYETFA